MKLQNFLIALLMITVMTPVKAESNEDSIRAAIQYQVNQRHPALPNDFWESLGNEALPVIKKMYKESQSANEKTFLIDGLAHFNDASTGTFLENEVSESQNEVLKKKLLSAVIQSEGERAFEFVEPYLKDSDGHIRSSVARGLMVFDSNEKIKKRLAEFKASEKTPWVLAELKKPVAKEDLQKTRKQISIASKPPVVEAVKALPALPEKNWAGIWRGSYVTENKMILVEANLTLVDAASTPMKWKVEFKLPKQEKQEWKSGEMVLNHFQTNRAHWMEIRNPKMDIVFLAQRKVK